MQLEGKTILITGASSGIGEGCARLLYNSGANVILVARRLDKLNEIKANLETFSDRFVQVVSCDICDSQQLDTLIKSIGQIDGLVNSAGSVSHFPVRSLQLNLDNMLDINFKGPANLMQKLIKNNKLKTGGSLVFIASLSTVLGAKALGAYTAAKCATVGLSRVLASELASKGIRSNSISPGMVRTDMADQVEATVSKEAMDKDEANYPLGYCDIEDVTGAVLFLLSDYSKKITGQNILIDGGYTIK